ncbi:hypothetical protein [Virgibacillus pantothenticus]|uniref:hypothetical protein n=1 Tax=Virgibacillus pantothenticus TaxID=1473 RepID=UPI0025B1D86D|nr:hypothetical protein [Virgibacillus pantothenticus]
MRQTTSSNLFDVIWKNNTSEIRVVKDKGAQGVLIYDLKSMYDKNADQSWIWVIPDDSHYIEIENEIQDVFNSPQHNAATWKKMSKKRIISCLNVERIGNTDFFQQVIINGFYRDKANSYYKRFAKKEKS